MRWAAPICPRTSATAGSDLGAEHGAAGEQVRVLDVWMTDWPATRIDTVAYREGFRMHMTVLALTAITGPGIVMWVTNEDRVRAFSIGARENGDALGDLEAGEQLEFTVELENPLSAGRYYIGCSVSRGPSGLDVLLYQERTADIVSYGAELEGLIGVDHVTTVTRTRAGEPVR